MKYFVAVLCILVSFVFVAGAGAAEFKVYPGAKLDEKETKKQQDLAREAKTGSTAKIYVTDDSFEKVKEFYNKNAKEYMMPGRQKGKVEKLPSGKVIKDAFFIFDGARDIMTSKLWAKVQRPYIGPGLVEGPDRTYIIAVSK